eukprot:4069972-Ditylum_brightwellii.AAC.1
MTQKPPTKVTIFPIPKKNCHAQKKSCCVSLFVKFLLAESVWPVFSFYHLHIIHYPTQAITDGVILIAIRKWTHHHKIPILVGGGVNVK